MRRGCVIQANNALVRRARIRGVEEVGGASSTAEVGLWDILCRRVRRNRVPITGVDRHISIGKAIVPFLTLSAGGAGDVERDRIVGQPRQSVEVTGAVIQITAEVAQKVVCR